MFSVCTCRVAVVWQHGRADADGGSGLPARGRLHHGLYHQDTLVHLRQPACQAQTLPQDQGNVVHSLTLLEAAHNIW